VSVIFDWHRTFDCVLPESAFTLWHYLVQQLSRPYTAVYEQPVRIIPCLPFRNLEVFSRIAAPSIRTN
jgi:hypothetical protein